MKNTRPQKNLKPQLVISCLICALALISGCDKDDDLLYGTVVPPEAYFPVYPGSYWKYVDTNGDTTVSQTEREYQRDTYYPNQSSSDNDPVAALVPIYDGIPIWGYYEHPPNAITSYHSPALRMLLSEDIAVGGSWTIQRFWGTSTRREIIARDTAISTVLGSFYPVIVVEVNYTGGPPFPWGSRTYYAKDVGIVRADYYQYEDSSIVTKELIEYYINW